MATFNFQFDMRYRLATYRECKAHREWNTTCPDCGRRGKFSPYIDTTTMRPVDDRTCGRCNRLSNCGYHLPPREMPRNEDFGSRRSREKRESPGPVNYASHKSHKSHRSCIAEGSQLPSGWIKQQAALLGETKVSFVATDAHSRRRRSRQQGNTTRSACNAPVLTDTPSINRGGVSGDAERIHYSRMRRACEQSQPWGSHLVTWLRTQFPRDAVAAALKRYRVGGTPDGATLWWQIDTQGRVHTGKAMQYNPLTGHRVKESGLPQLCSQARLLGADKSAVVATDALSRRPPLWGEGSAMAAKPLHRGRGWGGSSPVNWAHRMRLYGEPSDLVVPQCLFGLSLLTTEHTDLTTDYTASTTDYTDFSDSLQDGRSTPHEGNPCNPRNLWSNNPWSEKIGLVESEKTALIMSLVCPDKVWLATGGKQGFKESMLAPLIGLEVAVYPDADALRDWYARIVEMNRTLGTRLHIPTWYYNLMDHPEAIARGLDLADILMEGGGLSIGTIDAIVPIDAIGSIDTIG